MMESILVRGHLKFSDFSFPNIEFDRLRIAYLGDTAEHKGSLEWKRMINEITNPNVVFFYFGNKKMKDPVHSVYVDFNDNNSLSMSEALKENMINVVFLWSKCPETYCYTYYESLESGCFVLTNENSGNIYDSVRQFRNGKVFKSIANVIDYLNNNKTVLEDLRMFCEKTRIPQKAETNDDISDLVFVNDKVNMSFSELRFNIRKNLPVSLIYSIARLHRR